MGTSGWSYRSWVGDFYPARTPAARMLEAYAARLPTVEAHNTFRRRPQPSTLAAWTASVPEDFRFALKAHVAITHQRDLDGVEERIEAFFSAVAQLGPRLGPVLFQLPHLKPDIARLDRLLAALPAEPPAAFELGPAWRTSAVLESLDRVGAALVVTDREEATEADADLTDAGRIAYFRLRRAHYDAAALERWAARLMSLEKPAFVYFRHDGDPAEAVRLLEAVRG